MCVYCRPSFPDAPAGAACTVCGVEVCTEPGEAGPGHGSRCEGGCGEVVCEAHALEHAQLIHGARTEDCFPRLSVRSAAAAFFAAVRPAEAGRGPTPRETAELEHTFNVVSPGHQALRRVVAALPLEHAHRDGARWALANEEWVRLQPAFYTPGVLVRAAALCLRSLSVAAARLPRPRRGLGAPREPTLLAALARLAGPAAMDVIPLHRRRGPDSAGVYDASPARQLAAVEAWMDGRASRHSTRVLSLADALAEVDDPVALADWLLLSRA
jgi:hypothetical protein